ncbi:MAG: YciI family protein [Kofleriaceae bacterium]
MSSRDLQLFVAQSRPLVAKAQLEPVLPAHLAYMDELEHAGSLFASGPYTDGAFGEGMTILRATSIEAARALLDNDPFIRAGLRTYVMREWRLKEGTL